MGGGGRIFNNRLLSEKNQLFFPYCFLWGGQGLDGGGQSCDGDPPVPPVPPLGKTKG